MKKLISLLLVFAMVLTDFTMFAEATEAEPAMMETSVTEPVETEETVATETVAEETVTEETAAVETEATITKPEEETTATVPVETEEAATEDGFTNDIDAIIESEEVCEDCLLAPMASSYVTYIRDPSKVKGSDYTKSTALAHKLDAIFNGNASVYSDRKCTKLVNTTLGTFSVPNNGVSMFVGPKGGTAIKSGTSCSIYADGVYYTLFGGCAVSGKAPKNSENLNIGSTSSKAATYKNFKAWGVRQGVGAQIRADGHSMIVLGYDESTLTILDGNSYQNKNEKDKGLISIRVRTWDKVNFDVKWIVQPTQSYYESKYPECEHTAYKDNGICKNCGYKFVWSLDTSTAGVYTVTKNFTPRLGGPYDADTKDTSKTFSKGAKVTVFGSIKNAYGSLWYQIGYGDGTVGYVFNTYLQKTGEPMIVKYNANGGSGAPGNQTKVYGSTLKLSSTKPTRSGYTFLGWSTSSSATNATYSAGGSYTANAGATLYAVWKKDPVKYTITYHPNGGTCSTASVTVQEGKSIGTLPTPTFSGMRFVGWYTAAYGGSKVTSGTVPTGNMTVYAHYAYDYRISFHSDGSIIKGVVMQDTIDGVNQAKRNTNMLLVLNRSGESTGFNNYGTEIAVAVNGRITAVRNYGESTKITVPSGGFILSGHNSGNNSAGTFLDAVAKVENAYVYLDYETGKVLVFDSLVNYLANSKSGQSGSRIGELPLPSRSGYTLEGWYTSISGGAKVTADTTFSKDTVLYAVWKRNMPSGDITDNGTVDGEDALYLIWHTLHPNLFPLDKNADFTGDCKVTDADAVALLWHSLYPKEYPLQ